MHLLIWQRTISAGVRVADGDQADFYFVPVHTRLAWGVLRNAMVKEAVAFIRAHYPWWDKHAGGRHMFVIPSEPLALALALARSCRHLPEAACGWQ